MIVGEPSQINTRAIKNKNGEITRKNQIVEEKPCQILKMKFLPVL